MQGLDRYAYVRNSPLVYTDPSGHREYCEEEKGGRCPKDKSKPKPTELDFSKLSKEKGGRTGISAEDLYNYYLDLHGKSDAWWWKSFPNFTIWDFLSLIAYNESGYSPADAKYFAEAGVRFFIEWAEVNKKTTDVYGVLDWFARFSDSAELLIKNKSTPALQRGQSSADVAKMSIVGNSFQNIPDAWKGGWAPDRPYNWGNSSVLNANAAAMYAANHQAMFVTIPGSDPFYIPSGCAWLNWQQNQNQASCPAVIP